ncbi:MAG TPA: STAS domain-containing protein [Methylophilaceae bacterium]|nr:STAS domain-containing protein [Methylophilaceae bacterium]
MPIEYKPDVARLVGKCTIDETSAFYEWLQKYPQGKVDLSDCEYLHMSLLQLLMAAKPAIAANPNNPFLQHWLPYLR